MYQESASAMRMTKDAMPPQPAMSVLKAVEEALEGTEKEMVELSSRLSVVLRPEPPAMGASNDKASAKPTSSHLTDRLQDVAARIEMVNASLRNVASRLEI